ncbi:MAG: type III pantothenate kinase [Lachnospiraceae bacterium]|nr:type III pantothenate kinase [Lachnospiraceae bacterium]
MDVGNTNIVLGCLEDGEIRSVVRMQTGLRDTEIEYAIKLRQILEFSGIDSLGFEGAILSSVVPPVTGPLTAAVKRVTGLDCLVVGSVGAMACYGVPAIVLDMGTATTVVLIDKDGCYRGGAILPGVKLSYSALASGTSLLPDISITAPKKVIATNTVDSMRSGAVFGTAAAIDGMIDRMEEEIGYPCTVVATGGIARAVTPYCRRKVICDDDLLLKGLWVLWQKNRKGV